MQRLKKISISLCIAILLFNIVSPIFVTMAASKEYDHEELMQYDGYARSIYESLVEETTYITGQYTNNKEYVSKSIDQIKDYASFWWNEQKFDSEPWTYDRFKELIAKPVGYALTVGDWIKNFFSGYQEQYEPSVPSEDAWGSYVKFCSANSESTAVSFQVKDTYRMYLTYGSNNETGYYSYGDGCITFRAWALEMSSSYALLFYANSYPYGSLETKDKNQYEYFKNWSNPSHSFANVISLASMAGVGISIKKVHANGSTEDVKPSTQPNKFDDFKKYIDDKLSQMTMPRPTPYLSCPNGTKIQMSIDGGTFLSANGKAMIVNKDGTAQVDSAICQLGWDKPQIKYIDDRTVVETPGGGFEDAETGEQVVPDKKPEEEEEGEDGECGTLCALGKLTKFLLNFFEKLLDFFIKIFIPEDTDFLTSEFDKLKKIFDEKFKIVGSLEKTMSDFFAQENTNPLENLSINLPATNGQEIDVMPTTFIDQHVRTLKKVMSGFIVIMTVFYVYRKITGRGGVMEK